MQVAKLAVNVNNSSDSDTTTSEGRGTGTEGNDGYFNTVRNPFTNITALALFFPGNHGNDEDDFPVTKIKYIGLQGDHTHGQRAAVHTEYELIAMPDDDDLFQKNHPASQQHSHSHNSVANVGGGSGEK